MNIFAIDYVLQEQKESVMAKLSEVELMQLVKGGETNTVEFKVAAPRATEMAERLCGMANAQGGVVIIGIKDSTHEILGVPDNRISETLDVISRAVRQMIKPELVLDPPEPEIYVVAGKKLVVAAVKPSIMILRFQTKREWLVRCKMEHEEKDTKAIYSRL